MGPRSKGAVQRKRPPGNRLPQILHPVLAKRIGPNGRTAGSPLQKPEAYTGSRQWQPSHPLELKMLYAFGVRHPWLRSWPQSTDHFSVAPINIRFEWFPAFQTPSSAGGDESLMRNYFLYGPIFLDKPLKWKGLLA